ncbi:glycosyltransferase family 2 protein [Candidatus Omnitrophota bacterium]
MTDKRSVSIIIAVCNQLAYTKLCVRSILENTKAPFELIIVDNGSREEVRIFFEKLKEKADVKYIRNEKNLGPITAVNQGIRAARYDYICAIHNDVIIFEQGWLERMISVMEKDAMIGMAGLAGRKEIYKTGCVNEDSLKHNLQNEDLNPPMKEDLAEVAVLDGMCLLLKREALEKIAGLDEAYGYMHCYDLDLSLQVIEAGLRNVVVGVEAMHIGNGGITRKTGEYRSVVKDDYGLLKKNCRVFSRKWARMLPLNIEKFRNSRLTKTII